MNATWYETLQQGCKTLGVPLTSAQADRLLAYLALLDKWNKTYNLTAVRDPGQMVVRHLLDSLSVLGYCLEPRLIDVGTGAGLPGMPIAILQSDWQITLLDSNGKKTRFLQHVCRELGLSNVTVVHERAERYQPEALYQTIISRAVATLDTLVTNTAHLLAEGGQMLAMKGPSVEEELSQVPPPFMIDSCYAVEVPFLGERRTVVRLTQALEASS